MERERNYADFFDKHLGNLRELAGSDASAREFADTEKWAKNEGYAFETYEGRQWRTREGEFYDTFGTLIKQPLSGPYPGRAFDEITLLGRETPTTKRLARVALAWRVGFREELPGYERHPARKRYPNPTQRKRARRIVNPFGGK